MAKFKIYNFSIKLLLLQIQSEWKIFSLAEQWSLIEGHYIWNIDMAIFNSGIQDYSMPKHALYLAATLNKKNINKIYTHKEKEREMKLQ